MNISTQAVDKISTNKEDMKKIKIPRDCCTGCGKKKHSDKASQGVSMSMWQDWPLCSSLLQRGKAEETQEDEGDC